MEYKNKVRIEPGVWRRREGKGRREGRRKEK
jgi:hypothetical protein